MPLRWQYRETGDAEIAKFRVCGIEATVMDADGDFSNWLVRDRSGDIASGQESGFKPYHFEAALICAENALRTEVGRRKAKPNY